MAVAGLEMMAPCVKNFALRNDGPKIATFAVVEMPMLKQYEHWKVTGAIMAKSMDSEQDPTGQNTGKKRTSTGSNPKTPALKARKNQTPVPPAAPAAPTDGVNEDEGEDGEEDEEEEDENEGAEDLSADFDNFMNVDGKPVPPTDPAAKAKAKAKSKKKPTPTDPTAK